MEITEGACPGLHGRALTRLAGLRVRQGRLEDAEQLLSERRRVDAEAEATLSPAPPWCSLAVTPTQRAACSNSDCTSSPSTGRTSPWRSTSSSTRASRTGDLDAAVAAVERLTELSSRAEQRTARRTRRSGTRTDGERTR